MKNKYGFYIEEYPDGKTQRTLMTGDGRATFTDVIYPDGDVGIGIAYGFGEGTGTQTHFPEGTDNSEMDIDLVVRFESTEGIDAMMRALVLAKNALTDEGKISVKDIDDL